MTAPADILAALNDTTLDLDGVGQLLDDADHSTRLEVLAGFTPRLQKRLFEAAAGRRVTTEDIVPDGTGSLTEVIHEGRNTLPAFRSFQKRFCLPSDPHTPAERRVLWGYNHAPLKGMTGPGYFVAYDDDDAGEVVIDYRELPPEKPQEWPPILDNRARLGRFVYAGMIDRLRRVSSHVTIGRAYKDKPMNAYFALVRTPDS